MSNKPIYTEVSIVKPERVFKKEVVSLYDENAYESAQMENDRIEIKLIQEKQKLDEFRRLVSERIKAYRMTKQLQEEYQNMKKIQKMNEIEKLNKTICSKRVKSYANHQKNIKNQIEMIPTLLLSNKNIVESHKLSPPSLIQQLEPDQNYEEQRKKRISMIRSAYGAIERNQSRKFFRNYNRRQYPCQKSKNIDKSISKNSNKSMISVETLTNELLDMNLSNSVLNSSSHSIKEQTKLDKNNTDEKPIITSKTSTKSNSSSSNSNSMNKYLKYLKHLLKEKGNTIILPPLCQCSLACNSDTKSKNLINLNNLLDQNEWTNCANNCFFYNNPKGYAQFLIDLVGEDRNKLDNLENSTLQS